MAYATRLQQGPSRELAQIRAEEYDSEAVRVSSLFSILKGAERGVFVFLIYLRIIFLYYVRRQKFGILVVVKILDVFVF